MAAKDELKLLTLLTPCEGKSGHSVRTKRLRGANWPLNFKGRWTDSQVGIFRNPKENVSLLPSVVDYKLPTFSASAGGPGPFTCALGAGV